MSRDNPTDQELADFEKNIGRSRGAEEAARRDPRNRRMFEILDEDDDAWANRR